MEKEIAIELIKLDVLDRTDAQEYEALQYFKKSNDDFLWELMGYYQNLIAILAATSKIELPPLSLKNDLLIKLQKLKSVPQYSNDAEAEELLSDVILDEDNIENEVAELAEVILENDNTFSARENINEENNKIVRESISIKEPNFSNIHILIEDKKSKIAKDKELTRNNSGDSNNQIADAVIPEKQNFDEKPEPEIELIRLNHTVVSDRKSSHLKQSKFRHKKERVMVLALIGVIAVSAGIFLFINYSQSNQLETNRGGIVFTKTENIVPQEIDEQVIIQAEEIEALNKKETPLETPVTPDLTKPGLPKSPQIIEAPLNDVLDLIDDVQLAEGDPVNERQAEVPVSPPVEKKITEEESPYFVAVEEMPEPIGGLSSIQSKIVYPEIARRAGVDGKVFVLAFVDESGNVSNAEIVKGIGSGCDEAAMDAVLQTKFKPGIQRGKPVKVKITIPIVFKR